MPNLAYANTNQVSGLFTPSTLAMAVFPDVDTSYFPVSVEEAMSVPAVFRGVQLYSSTGSRLPLVGPEWLARSEGAITPALRLATTIQDLILIGACVWQVKRTAGVITDAFRVHPSRWNTTTDGHIAIDGYVMPDTQVLYFSSLMPTGFLTAGRDSVRHYTSISKTINNRSAVPEPVVLVTETSDTQALPEEIDDLKEGLTRSLTEDRGGLVYVPYGLEVTSFGGSDSANSMMIEARQAVRTDLANFLGISAAMLDGNISGASDIYINALQSKNEFAEFGLKTWTEPIVDRLSQPDACDSTIKFDYSEFDSLQDAAGNTGSPRPSNTLNNEGIM